MDQERARALLGEERHRLERPRTSVDADHDRVDPADEVSEDLADGADRRTLEETDEAVARQLTSRFERCSGPRTAWLRASMAARC